MDRIILFTNNQLPWRSKGTFLQTCTCIQSSCMFCLSALLLSLYIALNKLARKLDKRMEEGTQNRQQGFQKKLRVVKSPSKSGLPSNYPKWAVDTSGIATPSRSERGQAQPRRLTTPLPTSSTSATSSSDSDLENY